MASLSRRTEAQASKRAAIEASVLEATERLLAEGASYAELSIERIAGGAGISRTAFYFYFRDKRDLLTRMTAGIAETLYAEAEHWWSGEGPGEQELERALVKMVALYREHGAVLRAVVEASAYDEVVAAFWRTLIARFVDKTRARIEAEQAAGRVAAEVPAQATAFALCWMTERTCYQHLVQGADLADPVLPRALTRIWLRSTFG